MSGMATYTIIPDPDPEDGGYTVTVPALPRCVTEGETVVECIQNAEEAIRFYLDDLRDSGEPVPEEKAVSQAITVTVAA
jgi:antitoxin HicB